MRLQPWNWSTEFTAQIQIGDRFGSFDLEEWGLKQAASVLLLAIKLIVFVYLTMDTVTIVNVAYQQF